MGVSTRRKPSSQHRVAHPDVGPVGRPCDHRASSDAQPIHLISQGPLHETISILKHVTDDVPGVAAQVFQIRAIPTAVRHFGRQSAIKAERLIDGCWRDHMAAAIRWLPSIIVRTPFIHSDQRHRIRNTVAAQVGSRRAHFLREPTAIRRLNFRPNPLDLSDQVKISSG